MEGKQRFRTVIAGGGVAAIEAALALNELVGDRADTVMVAPDREFVYRPLAVAEPFGLGSAARLPLSELASRAGAELRPRTLRAVDSERRVAVLDSGEEIGYDALFLGLGARASEALAGALTYRGVQDSDKFGDLLGELERGEVKSIAFAVPTAVKWALPLYELALLTAWHAAKKGIDGTRVTLVTHEAAPLDIFGRRASESVGRLLSRGGVELRTGVAPAAVEGDELLLMSGARLPADRVVALPRLEVDPIPGIPQGPHGFIGTDPYMRVEGLPLVYAAGDATWFPVKQGGLATQQADAAASSIASCIDPRITPEPFRPILRAAILTGGAPRYLRSDIGDPDRSSAAGASPLWWPASKIAGRHLAPFLAGLVERPGAQPKDLGDLETPIAEDTERAEADHVDAVELALTAADADARWQDYKGALRWLAIAEHLGFTLPPEVAAKQEKWRAAAGSAAS